MTEGPVTRLNAPLSEPRPTRGSLSGGIVSGHAAKDGPVPSFPGRAAAQHPHLVAVFAERIQELIRQRDRQTKRLERMRRSRDLWKQRAMQRG